MSRNLQKWKDIFISNLCTKSRIDALPITNSVKGEGGVCALLYFVTVLLQMIYVTHSNFIAVICISKVMKCMNETEIVQNNYALSP